MLTRVALARSYDHGFPILLAAYAIPLHTAQESEQDGEKLWHLLVRKITPHVKSGILESTDTDEQTQVREKEALRPYATFQFPSPRGYLLSFSPGARYLAAALGGTRLVVWDLLIWRILPPLEIAGLADYTFAPAFSHGKALLQLLIAGTAGLSIATFVEATEYERGHGATGQWEVVLKASALPLGHVALHAASGHAALLSHDQEGLAVWALSTLLSPETTHLGGGENSPLCLHPRATRNPVLAWAFTPDGKLLMLTGGGEFTLHDAQRAGVVQSLAFPECPLATSINGLRLATRGEHGLILWERATVLDPFRQPRHTAADEGSFDESAMLEFSHDGRPLVLTTLGELMVYDWKQGTQRKRIILGTTDTSVAPPGAKTRGSVEAEQEQLC